MQHISQIRGGSAVQFPQWAGERHYMLPFTPGTALAAPLARFQPTLDAMLAGTSVALDQECYLMIDESEVLPGACHRRPGLHVDGYWHPASCHGNTPARHVPVPAHSPIPHGHRPVPAHGMRAGGVQELVLLASNYSAARALLGTYERDFTERWDGGDCAAISTHGLASVQLQAGRAYHLDVFTLHESLPVTEAVRRTVVRINVPNCALS